MKNAARLVVAALLLLSASLYAADGFPEVIPSTWNDPVTLSTYMVTGLEGTRPTVQLLGLWNNDVGTIDFDVRKVGFLGAHYVGDAGDVVVFWNSSAGYLDVTLPGGREAEWRFDAAKRQWVTKSPDDTILRDAASALKIVAITSHDLFDPKPKQAFSGRRPLDPGPPCQGSWDRQADQYNFLKSFACSAATLDANQQCSNRYCWGCCETSACSCICAIPGDFYCACNVMGKSCVGPPDSGSGSGNKWGDDALLPENRTTDVDCNAAMINCVRP